MCTVHSLLDKALNTSVDCMAQSTVWENVEEYSCVTLDNNLPEGWIHNFSNHTYYSG